MHPAEHPGDISGLDKGQDATQDVCILSLILQLALIFIFTLRNANKIPPVAGEYWAASEQYIIPNIMAIRTHLLEICSFFILRFFIFEFV